MGVFAEILPGEYTIIEKQREVFIVQHTLARRTLARLHAYGNDTLPQIRLQSAACNITFILLVFAKILPRDAECNAERVVGITTVQGVC